MAGMGGAPSGAGEPAKRVLYLLLTRSEVLSLSSLGCLGLLPSRGTARLLVPEAVDCASHAPGLLLSWLASRVWLIWRGADIVGRVVFFRRSDKPFFSSGISLACYITQEP